MRKKLRTFCGCNIFCSICILLIVIACKDEKNNTSIEKIDLVSAYENKQSVNLSELAEQVEYIPLKAPDNIKVSSGTTVFADDNYLVVISFRQQFIFNRKTGEFIREIGEYGRGPYGYRNTRSNLVYNEKKKTLYTKGNKGEIIEYSIKGNVTNKFMEPESISFKSFGWLNDSVYTASVSNLSGNQKEKIVVFSGKNKEIYIIPNYNFFENNPDRLFSKGETEGWFYRFDNRLFFKEGFNDTIFEFKDLSLFPKYSFFSAENQVPAEQRDFIKKEDWANYHWITKVFESDKFLFFSLTFNNEVRHAIFDKKKKIAKIADSENIEINYYSKPKYGFINDIDNFIQFAPHYMNNNNEIVTSVDAFELVNWFMENPEKAKQLPAHLQKLNDINETDNPVVMIAKLKE